MAGFFPRHAVAIHLEDLEEPTAFRKLTMSLPEMAVITGVLLHLYRSLLLTRGMGAGWFAFGAGVALGAMFLLAMTALHLGSFTVRRWLWRAPLFAVLEVAAEAATSLLLIALHREPFGSARAEWGDWGAITSRIFLVRVVAVVVFSLVLAGVVQLIRRLLLRRISCTTPASS